MTLNGYLSQLREEIPAWLEHFTSGDRFSRREFFGSRVVYYPGSGTDGHPLKAFGSSHSAHSFVYVDYGMSKADVEANLSDPPRNFRGYQTLSRVPVAESDLTSSSWSARAPSVVVDVGQQHRAPIELCAPFGFLEIPQRDREFGESHGARRLAILFLGADGIATYDALFCQGSENPVPFAVVLQDHGFGGNYDRFGARGLLERVGGGCRTLPRLLLVAEGTAVWRGYRPVAGVVGERGGMHMQLRHLHERADVGREF